MKKLTVISVIFLSGQLLSQTQSLAYRKPFSENLQLQIDSLSSEKRSSEFPSIKKIVFQEIGGAGMGALGGLFGGLLGGRNEHSEGGPSLGFAVGAITGFVLGNATGVYWVGNTKEVQGSFGYTLLGSCIGGAAGLYLLTALPYNVVPFFTLSGVGGIIAFYLSAEEVVPVKTDALIQIQNEKVQFGAPRIFLTRIDETSNKLRYNFELLQVNF
ncbi:MAG: hypothetical protein COW85_01035 [Ignavibacteria bacterium CG22_combo_CG10-13_8_21_14_all_37_15]|nr:MAG: hypothetical protein COW85_01035 [Ignavibacteria bacterium CG22_combo_CG10-13_8_21_14_all_37_15]